MECRQRRRYALYGWWTEVLRAARGEEKEPVLVLHQCGSRSTVAVVRLDFLAELVKGAGYVEDVRELSVQEG